MSAVPGIRRVPKRDGWIGCPRCSCRSLGRMLSCFAAAVSKENEGMGLRRTLSLLSALVLVTACATSSRMTPAERLEFYRANAGEPVRSFHSPGRLWGWRALGDSALTVWPSSNRGFLLELTIHVPTWRSRRRSASPLAAAGSRRIDSVVVQRSGVPAAGARAGSTRSGRSTPGSSRNPRRDLHDVDLVDRDPTVPDEPQ